MASSSEQLEKLISMRTGWDYTPKTAEQIRAQAEGEYQSYYDQLRLAAQQAQAQSDLRLAQQASSLQAAYDEQRETSARQYAKAYSQADRQLLSRGMQRSSYGNSTLANINIESARAQDKISQAQISAQSNIEDQRTLLQQQLAQQMSQYSAAQQADIMNRSRELEDIEYNRQVDAWKSQMSMEQMLYQAAYQQERDAIADQQWRDQMAENQRQFDQQLEYNYYAADKKSSGGGGGGSKAAQQDQNIFTDPATGQQMSYDQFMAQMSGYLGQNAYAGSGTGKDKVLTTSNAVKGTTSTGSTAISSISNQLKYAVKSTGSASSSTSSSSMLDKLKAYTNKGITPA